MQTGIPDSDFLSDHLTVRIKANGLILFIQIDIRCRGIDDGVQLAEKRQIEISVHTHRVETSDFCPHHGAHRRLVR